MNSERVYPAAPEQMWTPDEKKCPPPCEVCRKKCNNIFARIFFRQQIENFCSKDCWDKMRNGNSR